MNKKQRLKRAFTITELVIVIAVIAVLAAVLIPTFASVVKSANKSADEQYLKNISDTIATYTATNNGVAPKDYPEMMKAVSENGLCDPSNPYLLATKLKEDDVRMVWFPNTTKVQLVDISRETLLWQTGATRGMGNYALIGTTFDDGKTDGLVGSGCYVLCVAGDKNCEIAAKFYYDFYVTNKGNIDTFNVPSVDEMDDKGWANCIISAVTNAKKGYHNDEKMEEELVKDLTTNNEAKLEVKDDKEALSALATLATLANDAATRDTLTNKKVTLQVTEAMQEEGVNAKDVTLAAIGNSYRKESNVQGGTPESTVSVDYNNLKLKNVNVPKNYVSSGAEYQTAEDSGHAKGGYAFTYGMFGSIIAAPGDTVTIENLHIENVTMDFSGASEKINGKTVETFADNAGIIAGYVQGNVTLKNITIDGKQTSGANGFIKGYDAIAGVVGRAYGAIKDGVRQSSTLKLEDVHVSNLDITGERRASGFVGFNQWLETVEIKSCSLKNVNILAERHDSNSAVQCWATVFIHQGGDKAENKDTKDEILYASGDVKIEGVTLENVTTDVKYQNQTLAGDTLTGSVALSTYCYVETNPTGKTGKLLLVEDPKAKTTEKSSHSGKATVGTSVLTMKDITFGAEGSSKTYKGDTTTGIGRGSITVE